MREAIEKRIAFFLLLGCSFRTNTSKRAFQETHSIGKAN